MTDEIGDTIGPLHEALHRFPFVHAYPADHLYISIQELGFVVDTPKLSDELSMDHIQEFIRHASIPISDFPAFNVTLGGFNSFLDTPFLDVHDDGWCYRIHHRLRDFVMAQPDDAFAYLPHVMLGYYVNSSDMESFPAQMARWRDRTYGSFVAPSVDILKLSTHDPDATPAVVHSFELGHTRGAADTISSSPAGDMF